jgi:hypothetical protein
MVKETAFASLLSRFNVLNKDLMSINDKITGISIRLANSLRQPAPCNKEIVVPSAPESSDVVVSFDNLLNEMAIYEGRILEELNNIERAV